MTQRCQVRRVCTMLGFVLLCVWGTPSLVVGLPCGNGRPSTMIVEVEIGPARSGLSDVTATVTLELPDIYRESAKVDLVLKRLVGEGVRTRESVPLATGTFSKTFPGLDSSVPYSLEITGADVMTVFGETRTLELLNLAQSRRIEPQCFAHRLERVVIDAEFDGNGEFRLYSSALNARLTPSAVHACRTCDRGESIKRSLTMTLSVRDNQTEFLFLRQVDSKLWMRAPIRLEPTRVLNAGYNTAHPFKIIRARPFK